MKGKVIIMKKIISLLVALILVIGCTVVCVSAAPSPEIKDLVTLVGVKDSEGKDASATFNKLTDTDSALKPSNANEVGIGQFEFKTPDDAKYPLTATFEVPGVKSSSTIYVLAKKADNTVEKIAAKVIADGKIEIEFKEAYVAIGVIADKQTATNVGVSDKTGNNNFAAIAVFALALGAAVISAKKVNA